MACKKAVRTEPYQDSVTQEKAGEGGNNKRSVTQKQNTAKRNNTPLCCRSETFGTEQRLLNHEATKACAVRSVGVCLGKVFGHPPQVRIVPHFEERLPARI